MEEEKDSRGTEQEKKRDTGKDGSTVGEAQRAWQGRWLPQPLVSQCSDRVCPEPCPWLSPTTMTPHGVSLFCLVP